MVAQCVQRPGVTQVCMTLKLLQILPEVRVGIEPFLRGLGVLVQRNAPVQLVRHWLNLGMPRASRPLQTLPYDYDEEEKGATRRVIFVVGCKARPELNGKFVRNEDIS